MKLTLASNYYRPRVITLETYEECQILDTMAHCLLQNLPILFDHVEAISQKNLTENEKNILEDFLTNIAHEFMEQEPLWRNP
jgi:hypothetical protein